MMGAAIDRCLEGLAPRQRASDDAGPFPFHWPVMSVGVLLLILNCIVLGGFLLVMLHT